MTRKLMTFLAVLTLTISFGICTAYADISDESDPCPNCGEEVAYDYPEPDEYGGPAAHFEYVDDDTCMMWFKVKCISCGYEDRVVQYFKHDIEYPYAETVPVDASQHKIVSYGSCGWCHHEYRMTDYEKHSFAWVKDGNKMAYRCTECGYVSKTDKLANPLKISPKTATVKYNKLKKKTQSLVVTRVITFNKKISDKKTYTLSSAKKSGKSFKKYFRINKTTGKLTVKKGLKKGTYKVKIKVNAAGNANYKASDVKSVTSTVKVR